MRILITGANGKLAASLQAFFSNTEHDFIGLGRSQLDITDRIQVLAMMLDLQPDVVIHTAALTKVDYCAEHPDEALEINAYGTRNVALACQAIDTTLLYISTNEVFDGTNTGAYLEYDDTHAINPYGYSKLVGEGIVRDLVRRHYIVRTSWVYAHGGRNFIHAILDRAQASQSLRVVVNEVSTPTYADDLAVGVGRLVQTGAYGIYHLVNEGRASRWEFARHVLDVAGYSDTPIERISSHEYPRASTPPEYSVLRNFAAARLGITLRPWREAVADFCRKEGL
ncbi:MAG: dTDP-4-dehydrorhamnose reductase [Anaerolineales bacterium]|nr:dTDP-4-dehydrorhamnose reductase [Anaerolineales bacterium]